MFSLEKSPIKQLKKHKQFLKCIQKQILQLLNWHPTLLHSAGLPHLNKTSCRFVPVRVHYCDSAACEDFKLFQETDF